MNTEQANLESALAPLFQSGAGNRNTGARDSQPIATPAAPQQTRPGEPSPFSSCQGFCRLEKMPTHPANRWGRQKLVAAKAKQGVSEEILV